MAESEVVRSTTGLVSWLPCVYSVQVTDGDNEIIGKVVYVVGTRGLLQNLPNHAKSVIMMILVI